jgi:polysaccharide biosynthesis/export protein VpsN
MSPLRAMKTIAAAGLVALLAAGCLTAMPSRGRPAARYRPVEPRLVERAVPKEAPVREPVAVRQQGDPANLTRVLKEGDRLEVSLRAIPQPETFKTVVDEDGKINMPFIGDVHVANKTAADAQKIIEKRYIDDKIYKFINVIIVPPESEYTVSGEVLKPGAYPLMRDLTLLQSLARAGRFTEFADPKGVTINRRGQVFTYNVESIQKGKEKDPIIEPGDIIEVPRSWY